MKTNHYLAALAALAAMMIKKDPLNPNSNYLYFINV